MRGKMALRAALPLILAATLGGHELPREVVRHPRPGDTLEVRIEWARREARARGYKTGFWAAYSIERLTEQDSHIGSFHFGSREDELTLGEVVAGRRLGGPPAAPRSVRTTAREVLEGLERKTGPAKKVRKDIALLLRFKDAGRPGPEDVGISDLVWLGGASDDESLALVHKLYDSRGDRELRKDLVVAAGVHDAPGLVIPFLDEVLKSRENDEIRKDAAFWIGQQGSLSALKILRGTARTDPSVEVRKGAVFGLSQVELEAAVDELIELARTAGNADVRHEAVFWLGQRASKTAEAALVGFVDKDADPEVQEQAVFALSQLPDNQGVEPLIKIARTHPDPHVRTKAIFWLGECKDPRALEALIEIVKGVSEPGKMARATSRSRSKRGCRA
jgi:HEAT repeats/PBS lyase HEAT-like repeat